MNKCKYFDCGWCYAPDDVKTNNSQGECVHPECCPYLKSQNQMKETDISKVLIEGDTATINGVKYKRLEEPKPKTLRSGFYGNKPRICCSQNTCCSFFLKPCKSSHKHHTALSKA
jgi:hypothetical protein